VLLVHLHITQAIGFERLARLLAEAFGVTRRDVPYTNNACERALRPSVIFRKVTNCFCAEWGAKVYAAAASVIATGRPYGLTARAAISSHRPRTPPPGRVASRFSPLMPAAR
jgi:hypothetical protein